MPPDEIYPLQSAKQFRFTYHDLGIGPQVEELLPKRVCHGDEPLLGSRCH